MTQQTSNPFRVEIVSGSAPAWLVSAPLMTWHEIPNTVLNIAENRAAFGVSSPELGYVCAYSGGAWNGSKLYVQGGGHEDYTRGGTYGIDLADDVPVWFEVGPPRAAGTTDQITLHGTEYQGYYYPYDGAEDDRQNRFPVESHTYWNLWFDAPTNRLYRITTGGAGTVNYSLYGGIPGSSNGVNALDVTAGKWDGKVYPDVPMEHTGSGTCCGMDEFRRIWRTGKGAADENQLGVFDIETGTWQVFDGLTGTTFSDVAFFYDPSRQWMVRLRTGYSSSMVQTFDVGPTWDGVSMPAFTARTLSGDAASLVRSNTSIEYCADRDSYLCMRYSTTDRAVYEIKVPANPADPWPVTVLDVAPPTHTVDLVRYYKRWHYSAEYGGIFWMPHAGSNIYFMRTR
ncbi:MAG: hypothetical protein WC121_11790 [Candidatus Kapaibacterium sp.]